jgi:hypothetical protein
MHCCAAKKIVDNLPRTTLGILQQESKRPPVRAWQRTQSLRYRRPYLEVRVQTAADALINSSREYGN